VPWKYLPPLLLVIGYSSAYPGGREGLTLEAKGHHFGRARVFQEGLPIQPREEGFLVQIRRGGAPSRVAVEGSLPPFYPPHSCYFHTPSSNTSTQQIWSCFGTKSQLSKPLSADLGSFWQVLELLDRGAMPPKEAPNK
jgi:hypothetical protein